MTEFKFKISHIIVLAVGLMLFLQSGVAFCLGYSLPRSFCQLEI